MFCLVNFFFVVSGWAKIENGRKYFVYNSKNVKCVLRNGLNIFGAETQTQIQMPFNLYDCELWQYLHFAHVLFQFTMKEQRMKESKRTNE